MSRENDNAWGPKNPTREPGGRLRAAGALLLVASFLAIAGGGILAAELDTLDGREGWARLKGWVKDEDYRDLEGVRVSVGGVSAVTGRDGKYEMEGTPAGLQTLRFEKPGYVTALVDSILISTDHTDAWNRVDTPLRYDRKIDWRHPGTVNLTVATSAPAALYGGEGAGTDEVGGDVLFRITGLFVDRSWRPAPGEVLTVGNLSRGRYHFNLSHSPGDAGHDGGGSDGTDDTRTPRFIDMEVLVESEDQFVGLAIPEEGWRAIGHSGPSFNVSGVVDVQEGYDAAETKVTLEGPNGPSEVSPSKEGYFTFSMVPEGRYRVTLHQPGLRQHEVRYIWLREGGSLVPGMPPYPSGNTTVALSPVVLKEASEPDEVPFQEETYLTCIGLYVILAVLLLVAGLQAIRARSYTLVVFCAIVGIFLGLLGALGSPVCVASPLSLTALALVLSDKKRFD